MGSQSLGPGTDFASRGLGLAGLRLHLGHKTPTQTYSEADVAAAATSRLLCAKNGHELDQRLHPSTRCWLQHAEPDISGIVKQVVIIKGEEMVGPTSARVKPLDTVFRFAEDSFVGEPTSWRSHLRHAIGTEDGEHYLIRLFGKTGTDLDGDLKALLDRGLRRTRRVLTSRKARDVLVEVVEIVEDDKEIGVVMLRHGDPLSGSSHRAKARAQQLMTGTGRQVFWRNMRRLAEAITLCHDAGIVHGSINAHTIFSNSDNFPDYRLGGYESSIQIADTEQASVRATLRSSNVVSFRQDWVDLSVVARTILGLTGNSPPTLSGIEVKMLNRLVDPPSFQLFDGRIVIREITEVIDELARVGVGGEGELILYPSRQVLQSDLPALTSGTISASEPERVLRFVADDLLGPEIRAVTTQTGLIKIVTDLATYNVRPEEGRIGTMISASKRRPDDWVADAFEIRQRVHLASNRAGADERAKRSGLAAMNWTDVGYAKTFAVTRDDPPPYFALILLEAFSLLREQFRIYPVRVVSPPNRFGSDLVWVATREDDARDAKREKAGQRPCAEALRRELSHDEGGPDWTLATSDSLGGMREKSPELSYEGFENVRGQVLYAFATNEPVLPGTHLYLRPRRDVGTEQAVKRRLQNIVAARSNVELLRSINDPAQVAIDETLVEIAAPGSPPDGLDPSKIGAWNSIASGKSISVVVGPPGVGKTFLVAELLKSIYSRAKHSRILVAAQNHETLVNIEHELKKALPLRAAIVVRVERGRNGDEKGSLRNRAHALLSTIEKKPELGLMVTQFEQIEQAVHPGPGQAAVAERVFRDTETLLLRSSNVTLATTSSHVIEEMIADGEQFDWVFVEEAARANGSELVGALLLGNRRVIIGDHNQLSPFDAKERQKFYDPGHAEQLLSDARKQLEGFSDLPPEVNEALDTLAADKNLLVEVLGLATRLEEPFRSIAQREEERASAAGTDSSVASTLREQSRMHPAICQLVSETFYGGILESASRAVTRKVTIGSKNGFPTSPVVVLNMPSLSMVRIHAFEESVKGSYKNPTECRALIYAVKQIRPQLDEKGRPPTLVFLAPYGAQVRIMERHLNSLINEKDGTLFGFLSPRDDGRFVYTSDSFQGGEADVVAASLVRNNTLVGGRALGHMRSPQRMNVLLSRARQKLVLATSLGFLDDAVDGSDPDHLGGELSFLRKMISEIGTLTTTDFEKVGRGATIVPVDETGKLAL